MSQSLWADKSGGGLESLHKARPAVRRVWSDRVATGGMSAMAALTVLPVLMILFYIGREGLAAMSWEFLTEPTPFSFVRPGGGFLNGLIGTAMMVGIAAVISVPLGVLAAVYLVEYGAGRWLSVLIRFFADVMTGVPSVFVGLFVYTAFVVTFGFGALMGGIALAIIMLPIIVRSTEEMLQLVPRELKDASYALGAAKWQTVLFVVLPSALPGIATGVMLAIARAAGETAPLILTALGSLKITTAVLGEPISALTLLIFDGARSPFEAGQARAWAGALELLAIVLVFTMLARILTAKSKLTK